MHVLVVEDEFRTAALIRGVLMDLGFTSIAVAETEEDAINSARHRAPHLIISDVQLRDGLGPLAVKAIRKAFGPVKTFYLTGSAQKARHYDPGATVLSKPVVRQQLVAAILAHARPNDPSCSTASVAA